MRGRNPILPKHRGGGVLLYLTHINPKKIKKKIKKIKKFEKKNKLKKK